MIPKYSLSKTERVYITEKYFTDGKILLTKDAINSPLAPKPLKAVLNLANGCYYEGIAKPKSSNEPPDCSQVIPKRDDYKPMRPEPCGVSFVNETQVLAYKFQCDDFEIGIAPHYVPIARMGFCFAKRATDPILVLSENSLNGDLIGVIMPIRLSKPDGAK